MAANILETIAEATRARVARQKQESDPEALIESARQQAREELAARKLEGIVDFQGRPQFAFPFLRALAKSDSLAFICEVKKASPSKGIIAEEFPYADIAEDYERAGAAAISCLTEPQWFLGADEYLTTIAQRVHVPVLRKDFIVDEYMIYQAKTLGASAVLLIASLLTDDELTRYHALAESLGMSALVEARNGEEIDRAVAAGARIIGVNNRDLRDFSVDFDRARRLRDRIPDSIVYVAESGVATSEDVAAVARAGADTVLVGEALMRAEDRAALLDAFKAAAKEARP